LEVGFGQPLPLDFNIQKEKMNIEKEKISRIEVIGKGREYVNMDCKIRDILIQDDDRTMKIFLEETKKDNSP